MNPIDEWPSFLHVRKFDAGWEDLGLNDRDMARLQNVLVADPEAGDVIAGTGGLRKMRFARPGGGKSGSLRVCYALLPDHGLVLLMMVYEKNAAADLTAADRREVKRRLAHLKAGLDSE